MTIYPPDCKAPLILAVSILLYFTMFVRASTFFLAIAASVIASPGGTTINQCNTGAMNCCNSTMNVRDIASVCRSTSVLTFPQANDAASIISSLDPSDVLGMVGIGCNPLLPIAGGGSSCTAQAVCCSRTKGVRDASMCIWFTHLTMSARLFFSRMTRSLASTAVL